MGVPGFFAWLLKKDSQKQILYNNIHVPINNLYFDANCLFHPMCFKILKQYPFETNTDKLETIMIDLIIKYITYIIDYVKPTDLIYIAVDGVAPLAKINQQRKRRYKSIEEAQIKKQIYEKHKIPNNTSWSNIVITPGTDFMKKLDTRLKEFQQRNKKIVYSSYEERGEGEHKILQYLKTHNKDSKHNHVIYGLDADLIFLAFASNIENLYLLRERSNFSKNQESHDEFEKLTYVSMEKCKQVLNTYILQRLQQESMFDETETKIDFMNDFIFVCYFLGNDFLPHIPSINIRKDGLDMLIDAYIYAYERTGELIISKSSNMSNTFKLFLSYLADIEEDYFKKYYKVRPNHAPSGLSPVELELWNLDNLEFKDSFGLLSEFVDLNTAKSKYYEHYFHIKFNLKHQVKNICKSYFTMLKWNTQYYFEKAPSYNIQYDYDQAPFISDIYENFDMFETINITHDETSFNIDNQLLSVIPPKTPYKILNKDIIKKMQSEEYGYMFPQEFEYDTEYKEKFWLCEPILPYLDYNCIQK